MLVTHLKSTTGIVSHLECISSLNPEKVYLPSANILKLQQLSNPPLKSKPNHVCLTRILTSLLFVLTRFMHILSFIIYLCFIIHFVASLYQCQSCYQPWHCIADNVLFFYPVRGHTYFKNRVARRDAVSEPHSLIYVIPVCITQFARCRLLVKYLKVWPFI